MSGRVAGFVSRVPRRADLWVPAAVAATLGLRLWSLGSIGIMQHPLNYDEGAYFTTAALWARGAALHSEVTAVHPPGTTYALALISFLGRPSVAFGIARLAMAVVGTASAWCIGRIARGYAPPWAAATGVLAYAVMPDTVLADRSVIIEPLLNLACMAAAIVWLRDLPPSEPSTGSRDPLHRRAWATGALVGVALLFKAWGVLLIAPIVLTAPTGRRVAAAWRVVAGATVSATVLALPDFLRAPRPFIEDVVLFQASRRDGGSATIVDRIVRVIADPRHLATSRSVVVTVVVVLALVAIAFGHRPARPALFALAWFAAIAAVFVASPIHDSQYNAHLGPATGLMAAWAVSVLCRGPGLDTRARRALILGLVALLPLAGLQSLRDVRGSSLDASEDPNAIGALVRSLPECVFSFEAGWLIMGDRFADPDLVGPAAADPYVTALVAANRAGEGNLLLDAPAARAVFRRAVDACDTVILGLRGRWHLGLDEPWFTARFERVASAWTDGPDIWVRRVPAQDR